MAFLSAMSIMFLRTKLHEGQIIFVFFLLLLFSHTEAFLHAWHISSETDTYKNNLKQKHGVRMFKLFITFGKVSHVQ